MTPRPATRSLSRRSSRRGNPGRMRWGRRPSPAPTRRGKIFFRHHIPNTTRPNPSDISNQGVEPDPRTPAAPVPKKFMFPSSIVSVGLWSDFPIGKRFGRRREPRRFPSPGPAPSRLVCRRRPWCHPKFRRVVRPDPFPFHGERQVVPGTARGGDQPFEGDCGAIRKFRPRGKLDDPGGGEDAADRLRVGGYDLDVHAVRRSPRKAGNRRRAIGNRHGDAGAVRQRAQAEAGRRRS